MAKARRKRAGKASGAATRRAQPAGSTAVLMSVSQLAQEFGTSRETVRRVLDRGNVTPAGERRTNPTYRLRDVLKAWLSDPASGFDPDKLPPAQRAQHYRAESEKMQHLERAGLLCSALEVEQRIARLFKSVAQALDQVPDALERDCGASPAMVAAVEANLDRVRAELHAGIVAEHGNGNADDAAA